MSKTSESRPADSGPQSFDGEQMASLRAEKLSRMLQERKVVAECQRCGANDWYVDLFALPVLASPVPNTQGSQPDVPVLCLTCRSCGWIAMHAAKVLDREA